MKINLFAVPIIISLSTIHNIVLSSLFFDIEHIVSLDILCNVHSGINVAGEMGGCQMQSSECEENAVLTAYHHI